MYKYTNDYKIAFECLIICVFTKCVVGFQSRVLLACKIFKQKKKYFVSRYRLILKGGTKTKKLRVPNEIEFIVKNSINHFLIP